MSIHDPLLRSTAASRDDGEPARPPGALHWGIIGGGMMGLTLAWRLAQRGQRVTVCESAHQFGGLASAWQLGQVVWDRFYHVTLLSDSYLRQLLGELGLEQQIKWVQTRTGFYSGGKLYSMSNSIEFLRFPPLNLYQKLRLGGTIYYGSKIRNWERMERIGAERWLRRWSGRSTFEKIWLPLLKAKLGDAYTSVSASFIWSYIARMYNARRTGLKKEMFGYVPGGYAHILQRLADELTAAGVQLWPGHPVQRATHNSATDQVDVRFSRGPTMSFDRVVFTVPAPHISRACPQLTREEQQRFQNVRYLGVICASLLLRRRLAGYYVTNITDSWVPLTGVIEMTAIVDPAELGGHHLVYLPKYVLATDEQAFAEEDASIRQRLLSTLQRMYPDFRADDVVDFKIGRARNVMALPTLGYSRQLPPMKTSVPGVLAINNAHILNGNLNVNETLQVAEQALSDVLEPEIRQAASRR